jgi:hypothetical protein
MRFPLFAIVCVALSLLGRDVEAQDRRPDFSGTWVLEPYRGLGVGGLGHEVVLSQRDGTLVVESPEIRMRSRGGELSSEIGGRGRVTYTLNGEESVRRLAPPAARPGVMSMTTVEQITRAAWTGDQLVIVEHNLSRGFGMDGQPLTSRQTVRKALSLGADGTLVVDLLIVADPWPRQQRQDPPTATRWVYRKASGGISAR